LGLKDAPSAHLASKTVAMQRQAKNHLFSMVLQQFSEPCMANSASVPATRWRVNGIKRATLVLNRPAGGRNAHRWQPLLVDVSAGVRFKAHDWIAAA
jgi:hypothetical protein